jgi:predicted O-methyltransferase YrrM
VNPLVVEEAELPESVGLLCCSDVATCDNLVPDVLFAALADRLAGNELAARAAAGKDLCIEARPARSGSRSPLMLLMSPGLPEDVGEALATVQDADRDKKPTEPVDHATGAMLHMLIRAGRFGSVLEIGTGAGAAALWMAAGLRRTGGRLTTIERDSSLRTAARKNLRRAGLDGAVTLSLGDSARVLRELDGPFQMVFFDEDAEDRTADLDAVLPLCTSGALLITRGAQADPQGIAPFKTALKIHPDVAASAPLRIADGLVLAIRR